MAVRLLRVRRINLISMAGVMLGVASIIVVLSVMDGFQRELREMIRGTLSDVIVQLEPGGDYKYEDLKKAVKAVPGVEGVALQWHTFGLIPGATRDSSGGRQNFIPVRVVGMIPEDEAQVSNVLEYMKPAPDQPADPFDLLVEDFLPPADALPRVVVSDWIARRLRSHGFPMKVGKRFFLITFEEQEEDGRPKYVANDREVVVSRIYASGNSEYDRLHVYVDLRHAKDLFFPSQQSVISELRVKVDDYAHVERRKADIARAVAPFDPAVGAFPEDRVGTWEDQQKNLLLAVNNEKFILAFVLFFIVLVACFTIFATLTMTVIEKTREIGVLRALGATPGGILSIFMINGTMVGSIGAVLGYGLGILVANNVNPIRDFLRDEFGWDIFPPDIYLFDQIPTYIDHHAALSFAIGAAISALVFAIIPSVRAARLRPVEALRYE